LKEVVSNSRLVIRRDTGGRTPADYKKDVATDLRRIVRSDPDSGFQKAATHVYDKIMKDMQKGIAERASNSFDEIDRRARVMDDSLTTAWKTLQDLKPLRDMLSKENREAFDKAEESIARGMRCVCGAAPGHEFK
jgi:hypothetical protein